jgi:1-deoxy-D-xylulose-5-phosphate synthase
MVYTALDAAKQSASSGITCEVVNCRFIKPMDTAYLDSIKKKFAKIITLEEGTTTGGFGDGVAGWLLENGFQGQFKKLGLPDTFVEHGSRDQILTMLGLDVDGVAQSIRNFVGEKDSVSV